MLNFIVRKIPKVGDRKCGRKIGEVQFTIAIKMCDANEDRMPPK